MILIWHIRYFDTTSKQLKDRDLYLDTATLDSRLRATVELYSKLNESRTDRNMLQYRHLFEERDLSNKDIVSMCGVEPPRWVVAPHDYIEDEKGREMSHSHVVAVLTGNPNARVFPSHWRRHDIEYAQSKNRPIEHDTIKLSENQLLILGYFTRDLEELNKSAFVKDGPGRLYISNPGAPALQTAVNDEEIRAFVTTFRRLYMQREPASFCNAVDVFCEAIGDHPLSKWVCGIADSYQENLRNKPGHEFMPAINGVSFTAKRLIDVYLYTKFLHQPDRRRTRQFHACLKDVDGRSDLLMWLFLSVLLKCSLDFRNAGNVITQFFKGHCQYRKLSPELISAISTDHRGLGVLEKKETQRQKIFREQVETLAKDLWNKSGCPAGGASQFLADAFEHLKKRFQD